MDKDQKIQDWLDGKSSQAPIDDQDVAQYKMLYKNLASHYEIDIPPFLAEKVLLRIESQSSVSEILKRWLKLGGLALACGVLAMGIGALGISLVPNQTLKVLSYVGPLLFLIVMFLAVEFADQALVKNKQLL